MTAFIPVHNLTKQGAKGTTRVGLKTDTSFYYLFIYLFMFDRCCAGGGGGGGVLFIL